jgi:hypothetical protein
MVPKVQGAKEAEGFKLVLCPENSAECYRKEAPPKHGDGIEVSTDKAIHQSKDVWRNTLCSHCHWLNAVAAVAVAAGAGCVFVSGKGDAGLPMLQECII